MAANLAATITSASRHAEAAPLPPSTVVGAPPAVQAGMFQPTHIVTMHDRTKPAWCSRLMMVSGICGMIGLAVIDPALGAENAFDGVYAGKRVLTKGSNQACSTEQDVSVTIRGEVLTFTNSRLHDFPMGFNPHPDGSFNEITAVDEGAFWSIQGRIIGDAIEADVGDSTCGYHWHLKRTGPP